jgi:hypothetical protein
MRHQVGEPKESSYIGLAEPHSGPQITEWCVLMPIFGWFDTKEADAFAKSIADDLTGRIPVPVGDSRKKITPDRVRNAHDAIIARASAFARTHKLNWYKKAHLGNAFRWILLEKGYDKEFVDTWTHNLLVAVTRAKASSD